MPYLIDNRATESERAWSPGRSTKSSKSPMTNEPSPLPLPPVPAATPDTTSNNNNEIAENTTYSESDKPCMPTIQRSLDDQIKGAAADVASCNPVPVASTAVPNTAYQPSTASSFDTRPRTTCAGDVHQSIAAHAIPSPRPADASAAAYRREAYDDPWHAPHDRSYHTYSHTERCSGGTAHADARATRIEKCLAEDGKVYSFPKVLFHEVVCNAALPPVHPHYNTLTDNDRWSAVNNRAGACRREPADGYVVHRGPARMATHYDHGMRVMQGNADAMGGVPRNGLLGYRCECTHDATAYTEESHASQSLSSFSPSARRAQQQHASTHAPASENIAATSDMMTSSHGIVIDRANTLPQTAAYPAHPRYVFTEKQWERLTEAPGVRWRYNPYLPSVLHSDDCIAHANAPDSMQPERPCGHEGLTGNSALSSCAVYTGNNDSNYSSMLASRYPYNSTTATVASRCLDPSRGECQDEYYLHEEHMQRRGAPYSNNSNSHHHNDVRHNAGAMADNNNPNAATMPVEPPPGLQPGSGCGIGYGMHCAVADTSSGYYRHPVIPATPYLDHASSAPYPASHSYSALPRPDVSTDAYAQPMQQTHHAYSAHTRNPKPYELAASGHANRTRQSASHLSQQPQRPIHAPPMAALAPAPRSMTKPTPADMPTGDDDTFTAGVGFGGEDGRTHIAHCPYRQPCYPLAPAVPPTSMDEYNRFYHNYPAPASLHPVRNDTELMISGHDAPSYHASAEWERAGGGVVDGGGYGYACDAAGVSYNHGEMNKENYYHTGSSTPQPCVFARNNNNNSYDHDNCDSSRFIANSEAVHTHALSNTPAQRGHEPPLPCTPLQIPSSQADVAHQSQQPHRQHPCTRPSPSHASQHQSNYISEGQQQPQSEQTSSNVLSPSVRRMPSNTFCVRYCLKPLSASEINATGVDARKTATRQACSTQATTFDTPLCRKASYDETDPRRQAAQTVTDRCNCVSTAAVTNHEDDTNRQSTHTSNRASPSGCNDAYVSTPVQHRPPSEKCETIGHDALCDNTGGSDVVYAHPTVRAGNVDKHTVVAMHAANDSTTPMRLDSEISRCRAYSADAEDNIMNRGNADCPIGCIHSAITLRAEHNSADNTHATDMNTHAMKMKDQDGGAGREDAAGGCGSAQPTMSSQAMTPWATSTAHTAVMTNERQTLSLHTVEVSPNAGNETDGEAVLRDNASWGQVSQSSQAECASALPLSSSSPPSQPNARPSASEPDSDNRPSDAAHSTAPDLEGCGEMGEAGHDRCMRRGSDGVRGASDNALPHNTARSLVSLNKEPCTFNSSNNHQHNSNVLYNHETCITDNSNDENDNACANYSYNQSSNNNNATSHHFHRRRTDTQGGIDGTVFAIPPPRHAIQANHACPTGSACSTQLCAYGNASHEVLTHSRSNAHAWRVGNGACPCSVDNNNTHNDSYNCNYNYNDRRSTNYKMTHDAKTAVVDMTPTKRARDMSFGAAATRSTEASAAVSANVSAAATIHPRATHMTNNKDQTRASVCVSGTDANFRSHIPICTHREKAGCVTQADDWSNTMATQAVAWVATAPPPSSPPSASSLLSSPVQSRSAGGVYVALNTFRDPRRQQLHDAWTHICAMNPFEDVFTVRDVLYGPHCNWLSTYKHRSGGLGGCYSHFNSYAATGTFASQDSHAAMSCGKHCSCSDGHASCSALAMASGSSVSAAHRTLAEARVESGGGGGGNAAAARADMHTNADAAAGGCLAVMQPPPDSPEAAARESAHYDALYFAAYGTSQRQELLRRLAKSDPHAFDRLMTEEQRDWELTHTSCPTDGASDRNNNNNNATRANTNSSYSASSSMSKATIHNDNNPHPHSPDKNKWAVCVHSSNSSSSAAETYRLAERDGASLLRYIYIIQHHFRRSVCTSHMLFSVNAVLVMDGDMGVEMGVVAAVATSREVECMSAQERNRMGFARVRECMQMRAYREATMEEVRFYNGVLAELELSTLTFVKELSQSCCGFRACRLDYMRFLSCEFQADAQKLYVYYVACKPVRFLELATYLNQIFRCRIWIHEVNQSELARLSHMPSHIDHTENARMNQQF